MSRTLRALMVMLAVASCGSSGSSVGPRNLDNACSIVKEHPEYLRAFRATERKWGVPVHVQMATIYQESKFKSDARPPFRYAAGVVPIGRQSSALGYSQALDATWREYQLDIGKHSAQRTRIGDATDFMGWYMNKTRERNNIRLSDARNQYLAYHEGHSGFSRQSYRKKSWLMRVAGEVDSRAALYQNQLAVCRGRS